VDAEETKEKAPGTPKQNADLRHGFGGHEAARFEANVWLGRRRENQGTDKSEATLSVGGKLFRRLEYAHQNETAW